MSFPEIKCDDWGALNADLAEHGIQIKPGLYYFSASAVWTEVVINVGTTLTANAAWEIIQAVVRRHGGATRGDVRRATNG